MDPNLEAALADKEQVDLAILRATIYSQDLLAKYLWRGHRPRSGADFNADGESAEDFVMKALERLLTGQRTYNPEKSLLDNVRSVVESLISSAKKSADRKPLTDYTGDRDEEGTGEPVTLAVGQVGVETVPNEILEAQKKTFANLLNSFDGDSEAQEYLGCLEAGIYKRNEIAQYLGIDANKVSELRKRVLKQTKLIFGVQNCAELERIILEGNK